MSTGFEIDLNEMNTLVNTLEHAEERMTRANDRLRDLGPKDLGSPFIDEAAADFQDRWEDGIDSIADLTGDITEALRAAMKVYRKIDESVQDTFSGDQGKVGGSAGVDSEISRRLAGLD